MLLVGALSAGCDYGRLRQDNRALSEQVSQLKEESRAKDEFMTGILERMASAHALLDRLEQENDEILGLYLEPRELAQRPKVASLDERLGRLMKGLEEANSKLEEFERVASENEALRSTTIMLEGRITRLLESAETSLRRRQELERELRQLGVKLRQKTVALDKAEGELEELQGVEERLVEAQEEGAQALADAERAREELARGYYIVGKQRELRRSGVLQRAGRFGLSAALDDHFERTLGSWVEIRTDRELQIFLGRVGERIELVPDRPLGSYSLEARSGGRALVVRDPRSFWGGLPYLVVIVERE